jgi:hypothetical protein
VATHSTHVSPCNHRALEVTAVILGAMVVALLSGIALYVLGMAPLKALCAGAGSFAATFGIGMSTVRYIKQFN